MIHDPKLPPPNMEVHRHSTSKKKNDCFLEPKGGHIHKDVGGRRVPQWLAATWPHPHIPRSACSPVKEVRPCQGPGHTWKRNRKEKGDTIHILHP